MKTANAGENWVYLDGQIAKGSQPHSVLIHEVGKHLTGESVLGQVANTWLAENELPKGLNNPGDPKRHGIARGHYDKRGRPAIWESNTDRNHVMDAAYAALQQKAAAVTNEEEWEGEPGNLQHITFKQQGTVPTALVANMRGGSGEMPGEHRNRKGQFWQGFLDDVRENGIKEPLMIFVDPDREPVLAEGNHRRDAAVELGLPEVPVEIRYFGHAEREQKIAGRAERISAIQLAEDDEGIFDHMGDYVSKGEEYPAQMAANSYDSNGWIKGTVVFEELPDGNTIWVPSIYAKTTEAALELFNYMKQTFPGKQLEGEFVNSELGRVADRYNRSLGFTPWTEQRREEQSGYTYDSADPRVSKTANEDWRALHRPNDEGPPAYDLLEGGLIPEDIYDRPDLYTGYREFLPEIMGQLRAARGNPNAMLTIYRGAPPQNSQISTGDWVSLSPSYAKQHGMHSDDPSQDWPVHSAQVNARDVRYAGDDLMEWGYYGSPVGGTQTTAAYGYRETAEEMYAKIQGLGWDVLSQGPKNDLYSVTIRDVNGSQIERTGKTQEQAMASALTWAWQHSHMSGHIKDEMDLPIPTQTLGQVMSMLRPNKLDGNHLGLQAHKLGYSFGELQTLLRMEEAEGVQPGWKGFKEAALSAYASRGWKTHTASVELRLFSGGREDGQTGGLEKIEVPDSEEGKRIGYQAMSDATRNIYRAQIWDPLANREVWDSDKDWRQDPPKEEEQQAPQAKAQGFQQLNLMGTDWVTSSTDWAVTSNDKTPDYMFVYYQGVLEVEDYAPNTHSVDMLKRILDIAGKDVTDINVDDNKMSSGEITKRDGEIDVELTNLADLDVQEAALNSVQKWAEGMNVIGPIQVPTDG